MTYWRQRRQVELWKKMAGKPYVEIPDEVLTLEEQIARSKQELERLKAAKASEEKIGEAAVSLGNFEYRMKQILISKGIK